MKANMKTKILFPIIAIITLVLICFALSGCINLKTKNTPQKYYSLTIDTSANSRTITTPKKHQHLKSNFRQYTLEIYPPQIDPQFSGTNFIYRTSELNYTNDYYNVFFGFPAEQIQQNTIKYLQTNKIFKYTSDNLYPIKADYALKINITELYADYRNPKTPQAVISIQYVLINTQEQPKIVFNKTFRESIPLTAKSSTALVEGWNVGLQKILDLLQKLPFC